MCAQSQTATAASAQTPAKPATSPPRAPEHANHGVTADTTQDATVTYVVIDPTGALHTRTVDNRVTIDEWRTPYQVTLWKAVRHEVDPFRGAVNGVALAHGLCAKVADAAEYDSRAYPPNPVAQAVLTTLGHPPRRWAGTIAIVGDENDHGITTSLTPEQCEIIEAAHRLAIVDP